MSAASKLVYQWQYDWFCYWDESYGMPLDPTSDFVFRPNLVQAVLPPRSRSSDLSDNNNDKYHTNASSVSFVTSPNHSPSRTLERNQQILKQLFALAPDEATASDLCPGNESDYCCAPFLITWDNRNSNTMSWSIASFLQTIGAHTELQSAVRPLDAQVLLHRAPDLYRYLTTAYPNNSDNNPSSNLLLFRAGEEKLNPIPVFWVARLAADLVGGVIAQVVYT